MTETMTGAADQNVVSVAPARARRGRVWLVALVGVGVAGVKWSWRRWRWAVAVALVWFVLDLAGEQTAADVLLAGWLLLAVLVGVWISRWPVSWERWCAGPARRREWRRWARKTWAGNAVACGLATWNASGAVVPKLLKVRARGTVLTLRIRAQVGQTPDGMAAGLGKYAVAAEAESFTVRRVSPSTLEVDLVKADLLILPTVAPVPHMVHVDAVPVGRTEDGGVWSLPIRGRHTLVVGCSGSGKGSVLWGVAGNLAPAVTAGLVNLWGIDLKGGLEVGVGARMFSVVCTDPADAVAVLGRLWDVIRARQAVMFGVSRDFEPTPGDPLHVVLIDELAVLTAYADPEVRKEADRLLRLVLTQGRALGVLVVACVQDPNKETVGARNLFTQKVALRLITADETVMVLGQGMASRAPAHKISPAAKGTGYVVTDEGTTARVRAHKWTDDLIRHVADLHPAPTALALAPTPVPVAVPLDQAPDLVPDDAAPQVPARKPRAPRKPRGPRTPRPAAAPDNSAPVTEEGAA